MGAVMHEQGHMGGLDAILDTPGGRAAVEQVARLYRVVHGRPPDWGGLRAYAAELLAGRTLRELAASFLGSEEFRCRAGDENPVRVLRRSALSIDDTGPVAAPDGMAGAAAALAASLAVAPEIAARFPLRPDLFPDGARLDWPEEYRAWLATLPPLPAVAGGPSLSVIMMLGRQGTDAASIASVLAQPLPGLQLVAVGRRLGRAARRAGRDDPRVRLLRALPWEGVERQLNRALRHCIGAFTALLGPGDQLDAGAGGALAAVADRADIVLSDEDTLDGAGLRHSPRFGEAWDPDRVVAAGRPGMLLARTDLLRRCGGFRPGQPRPAWDLLLRAAVAAGPSRIVHLPRVLLNRRMGEPLPGPADVPAAERFLRASGQEGCEVRAENGTLRVVHPLPVGLPPVSAVIATRDRAELLQRCVAGLLGRTDYPGLQVVVVDNGSTEAAALGLLRRLAADPRVLVVPRPGPFNWAGLNNAGVRSASGEVVVLLNNDTDVLHPDWLRELASQALRPGVGVAGAKLLYPGGAVQHAGIVLSRQGLGLHMGRHLPGDARGYENSLCVTREVTAVTGACMALRRGLYQEAGGCDAVNLPVTWNDVDLCLRVRARGLRVVWTPHARLLHLEQASRGTDDTPENQARFRHERAVMRARWGETLTADPFLNPNLLPNESGTELRLVV